MIPVATSLCVLRNLLYCTKDYSTLRGTLGSTGSQECICTPFFVDNLDLMFGSIWYGDDEAKKCGLLLLYCNYGKGVCGDAYIAADMRRYRAVIGACT